MWPVTSLTEAADTISSLLFYARRGTDAQTFCNKSFRQFTHTQRVIHALSSVRRISENNAKELLKLHKSLDRLVLKKDYNTFLSVAGLGPKGVEALNECFKGIIIN